VITATWRLANTQVPMNTVTVHRCPEGFDVQLGTLLLRVDSQQHWEDLTAKVSASFASLPPRRPIPLPRTDSVKPTDYTTVNCSGACWGEEEE
jgi:hypothetical protein